MSEVPFRRFTATVLVVAIALSFLAVVVLPAVYEEDRSASHGADGFSPSAIGHLALVRLLEEGGVPVLVSRHDSGRRAGEEGVLLVLEPVLGERPRRGTDARADALEEMLTRARRALVVLPKWDGGGDAAGWVRGVAPRPREEAARVLSVAGFDGEVVRRHEVVAPARTGLGFRPTLTLAPTQVVREAEDEALVADGDDALLLEREDDGRHVLVLTDPDVLSNAGLHRGENAALVLAAVERLRRGRGTVVVDETLHGYRRPPSLTRELVTPPLVFGLGHVALALLLVVWAANARLGAPDPATPPFEAGTSHLVRTTAELLRAGGHAPEVLPRYLAGAVETVRLALGAPARLEGRDLDAWLDRVGARRGTTERTAALREAVRNAAFPGVPGARVLDAAVRVDRWRREISDGTERRPLAP
jgi:hypothetical protein